MPSRTVLRSYIRCLLELAQRFSLVRQVPAVETSGNAVEHHLLQKPTGCTVSSPNLWLLLVWRVSTASPLSPLGCCMWPPNPSSAACPCYTSPGKHPQTAEGWRQHDLREPSQHRLLEKPTQPIYTPTAAAEAEQTEHLQTEENSTASFQDIIVIHKMYSPFCSSLKKKLKLINLLFAMATMCSSLMSSGSRAFARAQSNCGEKIIETLI